MFRKTVTSLLMIEGGLLLAFGISPGAWGMLQAAMSQQADLVTPEQMAQLSAVFGLLQKIALAFGLLCLAGGWGASQGTRWGRWTAVVASVGNLPLLPFLTPLGIAGLFAFLREPAPAAADVKNVAKKPEPVSHVLVMVASLALVVYLTYGLRHFAAGRGLPVDPAAGLALGWILAGQLVFTLFHEMGHLLAAWAVGFQFHEICVGPFTLTERPGGRWAFRFDGQRILTSGGYLQAVPTTLKDLRMNWLLVVAAGPAASLFLAMVGFLVLVSLPGTALAASWEWAAVVTAICAADFAANLLPLGLTDGALLVHTALETERGKGIVAGLEAAMLNDQVDRNEGLMDPDAVVESRRKALEKLEISTEATGLALAAQRVEFARAALVAGDAAAAAEALEEAGKSLEGATDVPGPLRFAYWYGVYETATERGQYTRAADARQNALEQGQLLGAKDLDWDELAPVRLACARLYISEHDYLNAVNTLQETRAACPARQPASAVVIELLAVETECELQLGRREDAETLLRASLEIARELPGTVRLRAQEVLAESAARMSDAGEFAFARPVFAMAVEELEATAPPAVWARYRVAWAEALYENGELAEAKAALEPLNSAAFGFSMDMETLRAQLLLAENRPEEAVGVLNPVLETAAESGDWKRRLGLARSRALRSWALYRSGITEEAISDARVACDELMPEENPDAAPALLTLAVSVADENADLAEAYLQESTRIICESTKLSVVTKASRLTDLARGMVQVSRKDWGKRVLDKAAKIRG